MNKISTNIERRMWPSAIAELFNCSRYVVNAISCYLHCYFAPGRSAKYRDLHVCLSVCHVPLCICLCARISRKPHGQISPKFLCMLPVAVARSCSDGVVLHYVLPVLWMTSCFHATVTHVFPLSSDSVTAETTA